MAANDRPSTSSSPPPSPGPSSSASGDQPPDGQGRNGGKRKREETDRPRDTKCSIPDTKHSRVTWDETTEDCSYYNMDRLVACGQYREALAYTRTNISSKAKLQRHLQKTMIFLITDRGIGCKVLGQDYADIMMYLLSERLQDYNFDDDDIFRDFFWEFLKPDYTETLLKLVHKYATSLKNKRRMWKIMFRDVQHVIGGALELIREFTQAGEPEHLQERKKKLVHFVQMLPAILHSNSATRTTGNYVPMFAKAVELGLVQEAKLLYEAGAVNNTELTAVANKSGVQKMMNDEEDQSEMVVFLRNVLQQPQCLESLALLQVSRLVGQDVLGREDRVRQLPLPSTLRDDLLLRP